MANLNFLMLKLKGGKGSGNFGHSGRPGKKGGSSSGSGLPISNLVNATRKNLDERGIEDESVYVDKEARSVSQARSPQELKKELGEPILTEKVFGKSKDKLDNRLLADHLESKAKRYQPLSDVLDKEISKAPSKTLKLDNIIVTQKYIFEKPLKKHTKNKSYQISNLYVIKNKGKFYLNDNNHRVAAAKLSGKNTLDFKVIDIG